MSMAVAVVMFGMVAMLVVVMMVVAMVMRGMIMSMVVVTVMTMIMVIMPVIAMRLVIVAMRMTCVGVCAAFGIERRLDLDHARAKTLHHCLDDMIAADA
jgi:hypothetical protein